MKLKITNGIINILVYEMLETAGANFQKLDLKLCIVYNYFCSITYLSKLLYYNLRLIITHI